MTNQATLVGRFSSQFTYDHEIYGEKYYRVTLTVTRDSGIDDNIPVMVSERLINTWGYINECVAVKGQFRSYNLRDESKTRLLLFVFAQELTIVDCAYYNDVFLEGTICKPPTHRRTPYGREIADLLLAVRREYNKIDYIPCVCWGRTAKYISGLQVGATVRVAGRVQSREYTKNGETKTAYEVSVYLLEEC